MLVNRIPCRSTMEDCFATTDMTRLSHNRGSRRKSSVVFAVRPMNLR